MNEDTRPASNARCDGLLSYVGLQMAYKVPQLASASAYRHIVRVDNALYLALGTYGGLARVLSCVAGYGLG